MTTRLDVNIPAQAPSRYPILIGAGLITNFASWLKQQFTTQKIVIITDSNVSTLYGEGLKEQLHLASYQVALFSFPAGESSKSAQTKLQLEAQIANFGGDRHTLLVALGGGVVGDLAGFIAATYMRGIRYIQVPTSLLAMLDSSVGGKTAINTDYGKNIIGAFWQPLAVIMDLNALGSLQKNHIINGFFEAFKVFLTLDAAMVDYCQNHLAAIINLEQDHITTLIAKAVSLKAWVVENDEKEQHLRMILNFGHTVGHAIEKLSDYQILHGYAVGLGMLVEAKIAADLGLLPVNAYLQIANFLQQLGITAAMLNNYSIEDVIVAMRGDKKNSNNQIKLVLLTGIGQVKTENKHVAFAVEPAVIANALAACQKDN